MNILVAMSGGVDSSVAAALLKQQGHTVTGVTMQLRPDGDNGDTESARSVADQLGIEHVTVDFSEQFAGEVISDFCREYARGRTPNPCVLCNRTIKFGALQKWAQEQGADRIATGHYARLEQTWDGGMVLEPGIDRDRDQSYFLSRLTRGQLRGALFPVGNLTKRRVKELAMEMGLHTAERPESREICFIPDNDHASFVNRFLGREPEPGPILGSDGETLGRHQDITSYTVGQRHGLGISAPRPLYVTGIDAETNAVIVGGEDETKSIDLTASDMNWLVPDIPERPFRAEVKIRYRARPAEADVYPEGDRIYVQFLEPQKAVTPGQTAAVYRRDMVIGGAIIERKGR